MATTKKDATNVANTKPAANVASTTAANTTATTTPKALANTTANSNFLTYVQNMRTSMLVGNTPSQQWRGFLTRYVCVDVNELSGSFTPSEELLLSLRSDFARAMQSDKATKIWLFKNVFEKAAARHKGTPKKGVSAYYLTQALHRAILQVLKLETIAGEPIPADAIRAAKRYALTSKSVLTSEQTALLFGK